jgi:hypothetical protein
MVNLHFGSGRNIPAERFYRFLQTKTPRLFKQPLWLPKGGVAHRVRANNARPLYSAPLLMTMAFVKIRKVNMVNSNREYFTTIWMNCKRRFCLE